MIYKMSAVKLKTQHKHGSSDLEAAAERWANLVLEHLESREEVHSHLSGLEDAQNMHKTSTKKPQPAGLLTSHNTGIEDDEKVNKPREMG